MNNFPTVKVLFANEAYNYITSVAKTITKAEAEKYFVGKSFDIGIFPKDDYQECIGIEYTPLKPIKIIVVDQHTLAYTNDDKEAYILSASILKGATQTGINAMVYLSDKNVRLANLSDFDTFRVYPEGYIQDNQYIFNK